MTLLKLESSYGQASAATEYQAIVEVVVALDGRELLEQEDLQLQVEDRERATPATSQALSWASRGGSLPYHAVSAQSSREFHPCIYSDGITAEPESGSPATNCIKRKPRHSLHRASVLSRIILYAVLPCPE